MIHEQHNHTATQIATKENHISPRHYLKHVVGLDAQSVFFVSLTHKSM